MAKLSASELAVQYGYVYSFFSANSELKKLLDAAVSGQWSTAKFQAKFMATSWFRSREASVRQWAELMARDPKEAQSKIYEKKLQLQDRFTQMGVTLSDAQLTKMATDSIQWSWGDAELTNVVASYVNYQPGKTSGTIAAIESQVKQMAFDYGVKVSDAQLQDYIQGMMSEKYTEDNLRDFMADMARSKYGGMKGYLDMNMTVRQVAAPYLSEYARLMELNPDTVSLDDPLIAQSLQGKVDPKTGLPQMQTVGELTRAVKKDPRWLKTQNAKNDMRDMGIQILQDMGLYS